MKNKEEAMCHETCKCTHTRPGGIRKLEWFICPQGEVLGSVGLRNMVVHYVARCHSVMFHESRRFILHLYHGSTQWSRGT